MHNADEIAYWNGEAGTRWAAFQSRIDRAFTPLLDAGLIAAAVRPGESVLDIGSGCGATLLALAQAAGERGRVVGVDPSRTMLAVAERRASERGLTQVECVLADASTHAFDENRFDLHFSRFGVMFFDDPVAAFANLRRSLRSDGRVVFICWRELAANPWFSVPADAVRPYVAPQPRPDPDAPGPLAFARPDRVRDILAAAGFTNVVLDPFDVGLVFGDLESATDMLSHIGPTARLLAEAGDAAQTAARTALRDALQPHERDGEVRLGAGVWIVRAGA